MLLRNHGKRNDIKWDLPVSGKPLHIKKLKRISNTQHSTCPSNSDCGYPNIICVKWWLQLSIKPSSVITTRPLILANTCNRQWNIRIQQVKCHFMPTNIQTVTQNLRHNQSIHSEHVYIFCLSYMNGKK